MASDTPPKPALAPQPRPARVALVGGDPQTPAAGASPAAEASELPAKDAAPGTLRALTVDDLIQLPRFDAAGAVTLGERLVAVANAEAELPRAIKRAKEALEECLGGLRAASEARLAARMAGAATSDPEVVNEADAKLDACWTALFEWLSGYAKLPAAYAERGEARALLDELYPDGLGFIMLPYELEWGQSDLRIGRIASEPLGERLGSLGGRVFIEAIQAAHWQYGQLLGLPKLPDRLSDATPTTREALDRFGTTLRVYALKVTAHVEIDEPETGALAKRLLEPLLGHGHSHTEAHGPSVVAHNERP